MNSKDKGNIGEAIILYKIIKRQIQVAIPFGDNARYDLIADFNGKLNKIQVKYCNQEERNGSIPCPCASSTNHTTNKHYTTYINDGIDYMCFYLAAWDVSIIVPMDIIGNKKTIAFRKEQPKNNQSNVNLIDDYLFDKILI